MGNGTINEMAAAGQMPHITPFWERLPQFFLFPLQGLNPLALAMLSMLSFLAFVLPVPRPLDFMITEGLILLFGVRRGFMAMDAMSRGYLTPAAQELMVADPERVNLPWKLLGITVLWSVVVQLVAILSQALGMILWLFTLLTLPAAVMALSVTNSFGRALSPGLWLEIVRGVGKPYFALLVFLLLLSGGSAIVLPMLAPLLRGWLALPIINFTFLYFLLIMFAMMGYVLYQYHWVLGVSVDERNLQKIAPSPTQTAADDIARHIAEGNIQGALDIAYEQQRNEPENIPVQERYNKLLIMADKKERALEHGRRLLSLLLQKGLGGQAVSLFKRMRELDAEFGPAYPAEILRLAAAAQGARENELALMVMRQFDRKYPGHADIPGVYFLSAKILSEAYRRDDQARQILRALCEKFPGHEVLQEAEPYLRALDAIHRSTSAQAAN